MKLTDKQRYRQAFLAAIGVHVAGFFLMIILSLIWPMPTDDIIEVTLAAGDPNPVVTEQPQPEEEQKEEQPEEKPIEKDPIVDPTKPKEEQKEVKPVAKKTTEQTSSKQGDGGNDEFTSMPKALKIVKPDYPPAARNQDKQGTVQVKLLISSRGVVEQAEIINSGGYAALDEAVLKAVYKWRFAAAKNRFGKPCACRVVVPVKFLLK